MHAHMPTCLPTYMLGLGWGGLGWYMPRLGQGLGLGLGHELGPGLGRAAWLGLGLWAWTRAKTVAVVKG